MFAEKEMTAEPVTGTVTVCLEVSLAPEPGAAPLSQQEIRELTARAVESFTTIGRERIAAFNEISRVRHQARGRVIAVDARAQTHRATQTAGTPAND